MISQQLCFKLRIAFILQILSNNNGISHVVILGDLPRERALRVIVISRAWIIKQMRLHLEIIHLVYVIICSIIFYLLIN